MYFWSCSGPLYFLSRKLDADVLPLDDRAMTIFCLKIIEKSRKSVFVVKGENIVFIGGII